MQAMSTVSKEKQQEEEKKEEVEEPKAAEEVLVEAQQLAGSSGPAERRSREEAERRAQAIKEDVRERFRLLKTRGWRNLEPIHVALPYDAERNWIVGQYMIRDMWPIHAAENNLLEALRLDSINRRARGRRNG